MTRSRPCARSRYTCIKRSQSRDYDYDYDRINAYLDWGFGWGWDRPWGWSASWPYWYNAYDPWYYPGGGFTIGFTIDSDC